MLHKAREFFRQAVQAPRDVPGDEEHALRLATAALLVEMTRADHVIDDREKNEVVQSLRQLFELTESEACHLAELAEEDADGSVSLYQYTRLINDQFEPPQKIRIIEMLWRIAFADERKDKYEEYLVRKVADLIHVRHSDYILARHRVETRLSAVKEGGSRT